VLKNFTLFIEKDYNEMSQRAANIFASAVSKNPSGAYGFATGSTPIGMYEELVKMQNKSFDLTKITAFNLDEYYPINQHDPQSYFFFMKKYLFDPVGLPISSTNIPSGAANDPVAECVNYDKKIEAAGGLCMQILGIGANGHIGFNEPASELFASTHCVPLSESTITANARNFASQEDVPRSAITMGMHSIMMAKQILLLASGDGKAEIMKKAIYGPITTEVPASLLQLHHNVTVVTDAAAGKLL